MERRGGGSRAQFSLNPQSINTRTFNATLVLNSGSETKWDSGTSPNSSGSSLHQSHPLLSPSTLPASVGFWKGPLWLLLGISGPGRGMAVGVLGIQAPETYLSSPQSLFFPPSYCPCSS